MKFQRWLEKKGNPISFAYYESNMVDVNHNTWWIDLVLHDGRDFHINPHVVCDEHSGIIQKKSYKHFIWHHNTYIHKGMSYNIYQFKNQFQWEGI